VFRDVLFEYCFFFFAVVVDADCKKRKIEKELYRKGIENRFSEYMQIMQTSISTLW
jgi:hypothetical protein